MRGEGPRCGYVDSTTRPPENDVAARLAEIPPDTRDVGAMLLGDPVFERSALASFLARPRRRIGQLPPVGRDTPWGLR